MVPTEVFATSVRPAAPRRAPGQVRAFRNGDQAADARPVEPDGSKTSTEPRDLRCSRECSIRSVLMLAATTGPSHPRMAGTAKPLVLCDWLGPKTMTDRAGSDASRCLPMRPSTSRLPGNRRDRSAAGTISDRTSPARAQRASLARPPRERRPGGGGGGCRLPIRAVSYTHLRAHETVLDLVC